MSRRVVAVILAGLFAAAVWVVTLRSSQVHCEVCVSYRNRSACRSISAVDREQALQAALSSACAVLSSGTTEGLRCQRRGHECSQHQERANSNRYLLKRAR